MLAAQEFTSKTTSIDSTRLPILYSVLPKFFLPEDATIWDSGCGKYIGHIKKYVMRYGWQWYGTDPYNTNLRKLPDNAPSLFDAGLSSNVMNVIKEDVYVIRHLNELLKRCRVVYAQVHEGDRSSNGRQTGPDQWQRNMTMAHWQQWFKDNGYLNVGKKHGVFIIGQNPIGGDD